jgi:hypothetical protein
MNHFAKTTVVYFMDTLKGIRIGKGNRSRIRSQLGTGNDLLVCLPASEEEEKRLHAHFAPIRIEHEGSSSIYEPTPELQHYIVWLVQKGFAAPSYKDAIEKAALTYRMWTPVISETNPRVQDLFSNMPLKARIKLAWIDAETIIESDSWYIPKEWAERARAVMGKIDLDPASTIEANRHCVGADKWYTKEVDGLDPTSIWYGNIWLNPPYGRGEKAAAGFIARLCDELDAGNVQQAITCVQDWSIGSAWFAKLLRRRGALHCIPSARIQFIPPSGTGKDNSSPNKGNLFSYVGPNKAKFGEIFGETGTILGLSKYGVYALLDRGQAA